MCDLFLQSAAVFGAARQPQGDPSMKPLVLTVYVWQRKPYWLRHAGKVHQFQFIRDARAYAESHGRDIRVKFKA
jgi:hypothetical protein